jgi:hypothetical protein
MEEDMQSAYAMKDVVRHGWIAQAKSDWGQSGGAIPKTFR